MANDIYTDLKERVRQTFRRGRYWIKKRCQGDVWNEVIEATKFLPSSATHLERIYCVLHEVKEKPQCQWCGEENHYIRQNVAYSDYCSGKCAVQATREDVMKKHKETCKRRYGGHHRQKHYTDYQREKLNDKLWLTEQHHQEKKFIKEIAKDLGVSQDTVSKSFHQFNIEILTLPSSMPERALAAFVKSIYGGEVLTNNRQIIKPRELDIYLPELSKAIEFDGTYWHSEEMNKTRSYFPKTKIEECSELGIELIHVLEEDWNHDREGILTRLEDFIEETVPE